MSDTDLSPFASERAPVEQPVDPKAIADLDDWLQAILRTLPRGKPWQRQLHVYLTAADRQIQVLRLTISLGRGYEVSAAIADVQGSLRAASKYVATGRADMGKKLAVQLTIGRAHV